MILWEKIEKLITKLFPIWLILFSSLAYLYPGVLKNQVGLITPLIGLIMLGMGLSMTPNDFKLVLLRPKDVLAGIVLRYTIMPLVALFVAKLLNLSPELAVGLILVGCCPSGSASNVITFLAKGDIALSVAVSSCNVLLAPLLLPPTFMLLAGEYIYVDAMAMFLDTVKVIIIPVTTGLLVRTFFSGFAERIMKIVPAISVVVMLWVIPIVVAVSAANLKTVAATAFAAVALHNGIGFGLGYGISKGIGMAEKKARAICFEVGIEMSGLAVVLAMAHLDPLAAVPGAIFSVWHNLVGSFIASYWANKAEEKELTDSV